MKPGWKTTEFWTSIPAAIVGLLILFGLMTPTESTELINALEKVIGGVMSIIPIVGYTISRGKAKAVTFDPAILTEILASIAKQKEESKDEKIT